jgi:mono/diheme cytochrome c family protein
LKKFYAAVGLSLIGVILIFAIVSFLRENWAAAGTPGGVEQWFARLILFRSRNESEGLKNPLPVNENTLAAGHALYDKHCAFCHGQDGDGPPASGMQFYPPVPSLKTPKQSLTEGQIFSVVRLGIRYTAMPGFSKALTDEEIWKVTGYVGSLPTTQPMPDTEAPDRKLNQ